MKKLIAASVAVVSTLGVASIGGTASADIGDGQVACNVGEICFYRFKNQNLTRQFFNASTHSNQTWFNVKKGTQTARSVKDDASWIANRDTVCVIKVVNDRGVLPDSVQEVPKENNSEFHLVRLKKGVRKGNDRHERPC